MKVGGIKGATLVLHIQPRRYGMMDNLRTHHHLSQISINPSPKPKHTTPPSNHNNILSLSLISFPLYDQSINNYLLPKNQQKTNHKQTKEEEDIFYPFSIFSSLLPLFISSTILYAI